MVKIRCPHRTSIFIYIIPLVECAVLCGVIVSAIGYTIGMSNLDYVKENWQTLKCNPQYVAYYPFLSNDVEKDLTSCVQSIMSHSIGEYLNPLNGIFTSLTSLGGDISSQLNTFGTGLDYIRSNISSVITDFFGYILKIFLIFYKFQIALKQILSRFVGVMMASVYMMRGQMYFGNSIWKGPPGQMIRVLSNTKIGNCFHGNTKVQLTSGDIKKMSEVVIGDKLIGDILVVATMKILNVYNEPYYELAGGIDGEPIHVSGTHYVYNHSNKQFQIVETLAEAKKTEIYTPDMYCLITDNNVICIGHHIFWDWEDYKINILAR